LPPSYFFVLEGGSGTSPGFWHFPLPGLVPTIRPEASRVTARSFWRSMVWTIRPEASRTTSRQVWDGETAARANDRRTGRRRGSSA
jgi:hypothetical protein